MPCWKKSEPSADLEEESYWENLMCLIDMDETQIPLHQVKTQVIGSQVIKLAHSCGHDTVNSKRNQVKMVNDKHISVATFHLFTTDML